MTILEQFGQSLKPRQEYILQAVRNYIYCSRQDTQAFTSGISDDVGVYSASQPNYLTGETPSIPSII